MTREKIQAVAAAYAQDLKQIGYQAERRPQITDDDGGTHILYMAETVASGLYRDEEMSIGKMNRWLGFIQGWMWTVGMYNVDQLKETNRPEG